MHPFWATCDPGLEDLAFEEAQALGIPADPPTKLSGRLQGPPADRAALAQMRSIYHHGDTRLHHPEGATSLEAVVQSAMNCPWPELEAGQHFRVTCERKGSHAFQSTEVERQVGAALHRHYGAPVSMRTHDCEVRIDIRHADLRIGRQHSRESLHRRYALPFQHRAPIKPTTAFGLLQLARLQPGQRLLDPFCGGGTLALEAASLGLDLQVQASDLHADVVEGATANAAANGLAQSIEFRRGDARDLSSTWGEVDQIVSNLPFGKKVGQNLSLSALYRQFLASAVEVLSPEGRLTLFTQKGRILRFVAHEVGGLETIHQRSLRNGHMHLYIYVFKKK